MIYTIVVENSDKSENREYSINIDPLYKKNNVYDSINIDSKGVVTITRRIGIDTTIGESYILPKPIDTVYGDIDIELYEGINYISLKDDNNTIISVKYIIKNDFTDTYATKIELNSSITQTTESIMTEVNKKVGEEELNSAITQTSDTIMTEVSKKVEKNKIISRINQTPETITIDANRISLAGKSIDLTAGDITISSTNFNVDKDGNMICNNANVNGKITSSNALITGGAIDFTDSGSVETSISIVRCKKEINGDNMVLGSQNISYSTITSPSRTYFDLRVVKYLHPNYYTRGGYLFLEDDDGNQTIIEAKQVRSPVITPTSKEEDKKNFEKFKDNALDIIKDIDIYKYNLKFEEDNDKKHIGFVIGDKYKYSKEVTSKNNDGVDLYSFISVCCKAIQEQQEMIEKQQKEIDTLKKEIKKIKEEKNK